MKKRILILALIVGCLASAKAAPVTLDEARSLGQRFVSAHFEFERQSQDLTLVYSKPAFYVFNVGQAGYIILSADDSYRPVIGYSVEANFDPENLPPALSEYLDNLNDYRVQRGPVRASLEAERDWHSLRTKGTLVSRHGGRPDEYLVETKWNQNFPYNYFCPEDEAGPGGHTYAGCVATAASQLMKYWNHPVQGTGSHSYIPETNPQYGTQYANFGETTYDWEHMPNSISSASPQVEIEAIALLQYHVGVSVDMNYKPTGSGAATNDLITVMPMYFDYSNHMEIRRRENYSHEGYMQELINSFDMRWPVVHAGGGHAYVFDGYNDFDMIHVNWGWGGSSDNWYDIDDHGYTDGMRGIFNYVPKEIYDNSTPKAPTDLVATPDSDVALSATVTWNNPSQTLGNLQLTSLDQIVLMRGTQVVFTEDNPTPGAAMTFVDQTIPCYDRYEYTVYAVLNGQRGPSIQVTTPSFGPTCSWKFIMSSTNFVGWREGYIAVYNNVGTEIARLTVDSSVPLSTNVDMPLGWVSLRWVGPSSIPTPFDILINVKDAQNNSVYSYSGPVEGMEEGVFYENNNGCGQMPECGTPSSLTATQENGTDIVLHWTGVDDPGYGYLVYRDSVAYRLIQDGVTEFRDENVPLGGHCYQVTTLCEGGWNGESSNMACEASGACYAPRNIDYEMTSNFKCKLVWEQPEGGDLTGYYLYRKRGDGDYQRIKLLNANVTTYTDNTVTQEDDYYYQLLAYYRELDCLSAPAAYAFDPNQYFVHFYYSPTGVGEEDGATRLFPNPAQDQVTVEAEGLDFVELCNVLGQPLTLQRCQEGDTQLVIDLKNLNPGLYIVRIHTMSGVATRQVVKR